MNAHDWNKALQLPKDKAKARVAVAKDVQKHILAGKMRIGGGSYVRSRKTHETMEGLIGDCHVCAMGAVFLSAFNVFDGQIASTLCAGIYFGVDGMDIIDALDGLFSERQLREMERAFEYSIDWHKDNPSPADRLFAIMQNVIDNKGTFKVKQVYVTE